MSVTNILIWGIKCVVHAINSVDAFTRKWLAYKGGESDW